METTDEKKCVLNRKAIQRKIERMALEVAEQNISETDLVIAGIEGNGEIVASCLINELQKIAAFSIQYMIIRLNKKEPSEVTTDKQIDLNNRTVLLVDDVANTGKTMLYALKPILMYFPRKVQTFVLVERSHKIFPVQTDYTGLSISTTLQEHIIVEANGKELTAAWLY